jgi:uracil-DNA glycosylase
VVPRGKRRIHSKPSSMEIRACLPRLEAGLEVVQPEVIVLFATAGPALLGPTFRVTRAFVRELRQVAAVLGE